MEKKMLVMIVLAVLIIVSLVQAFQLNQIKTSIQEGNIKTAKSVTPTAQSGGSGGAGLPRNLEKFSSIFKGS